jgi:endonuclease YncB( thermonuclease family)
VGSDGDTVTAQTSGHQQIQVRLAGIDAPEEGQPFGSASREHLSELILGKDVNLECSDVDPYGRSVCKVLLSTGEDIDLDQLKAGMAWHYKQYQSLQSDADRNAYGAAENEARHSRAGLWADAHSEQPQDFRHHTRSEMCFANGDHRIACSEAYTGPVRGNKRSGIYHWPGCPNYDDIAEHNAIEFLNAAAAEKAGFRAARNCP